jgi:hypothetical protein
VGRGVSRVLISSEVEGMRERVLEAHPYWLPEVTESLIYTVQSREGTLRRLYNAVIATPMEGTELREAMRETERALGLDKAYGSDG